MDNHLTPNKIKRLIHIAEDKSYTRSRRLDDDEDAVKRIQATQHFTINCESSSGILDLDQVESFEEFDVRTETFSKSSAFNPGEMTGRSTGTDEIKNRTKSLGGHSIALATITSEMDKQTHEVQDLMRHSICNTTNFSFHSKKDLSAAEASFVMREAPLPILLSTTQTYLTDSATGNSNSDLSVGAYFQNRCSDLGKMLTKTDSPDRFAHWGTPSITEVTPLSSKDQTPAQIPQMDESLDCVPVRQSRIEKLPEKININTPGMSKNYEKQSFHSTNKFEKNNDTYNKASEQSYSAMSNLEPHFRIPKTLNPVASSSFASYRLTPSSKPTDLLLKDMNSSLRLTTNNTEDGSTCPSENSLSISKIADFLGKESNVSVSAMLKYNNVKKPLHKKKPLTELHMNLQENKNVQVQVTNLCDTRKIDTASSVGTLSTVISVDSLKVPEGNIAPAVVVTNCATEELPEYKDIKQSPRSKSPSNKSQSTLSTVHENCTSFKSGDSPQCTSKGEVNKTHVPSPNVEYRELDKSVDWREVLQQKRLVQQSLAKEQWAEITASAANGFVGVSCPVNITVTTLSENWLTAKLQFKNLPNDGKDLTIELPRLPLLLSPGKSEQFTLHITSNVELDTTLSYTIFLKDASIEEDIEQKGSLEVHIKVPIIQAMSCDGVNKVSFPPIQELSSVTKSLVLISDCPVDLQLDLSVIEGDGIFTIKTVQEIKKSDVNKVLMNRQASFEEVQQGKAKSKGLNKQLCRLSSGNAIKVSIKFNAPKLSDLQTEESIVTFNGALSVNLIGVNTMLRKVDLIGFVGTVKLIVKSPGHKLQLTNEPTNLPLCNMGSVPGVWMVKFANANTESLPFKVAPCKFDIRPGGLKNIALCYTGPEDTTTDATLVFEDLISGHKTTVEIAGGIDTPKVFPIKTSYNILSFVRCGRKEVSLKNSTNKKIHMRIYIVGEGFSIDLPGMESKGVYCLPFAPCECRSLPIMFSPVSNIPQSATLHLVFDKNIDLSRTVKLFGCTGGDSMRWSGLVTYGETALVRAVSREPVKLELFNKCPMPAFVCAKVHFNLQYNAVSATARLLGGNRVVGGKMRHSLTLLVDWARVEKRARDADTAALATVTVLTGAEITRRRILKILRDESGGVLDTALLDDHLKVLVGQFEGEDPDMDDTIKDFMESKASLNELIGGLHELTAQIVLPQDFADENTIVITDDTIVEHHTLRD